MATAQPATSTVKAPPPLLKNGVDHDPVPPAAQATAAESAVLPAQAANAGAEGSALLGQVIWLHSQSPAHRHLFLADLDWAIVPPVALRQFYMWKRNNIPVGYACWAYVNDTVAERMRQGVRRLAPAEWNCGDQMWLIDLVVPFGGRDAALKELREKIHKDKRVKLLQPTADGKGVQVAEW